MIVPALDARKLEAGLNCGADALVIDLENSIAPSSKAEARREAATFLAEFSRSSSRPRLFVRLNDLDSGFCIEDLSSVVPERPDAVILPKPKCGADVIRLSKQIDVLERYAGLKNGGVRVIAMTTDTPNALLSMQSFTTATSRLMGLGWGKSTLRTALGAASSRDSHGHITAPYALARSLCIITAHAAEVQAIDCIYGDFRNSGGLARECLEATRDGFTAKFAVHPSQVPIINEAFTPTIPQIQNASAIIAAFEAEGSPGAIALQGRMYYRADLQHAQNVMKRAAPHKNGRQQPARG
ncbi:MAG: CoA ester lyase [Hyphomicrobiales bacterium]|nr:CoA ester lyase [Hyphomicrobiales bacterium]